MYINILSKDENNKGNKIIKRIFFGVLCIYGWYPKQQVKMLNK